MAKCTILSILIKAREYVRIGWTQGAYARASASSMSTNTYAKAKCVCAAGAIEKASGLHVPLAIAIAQPIRGGKNRRLEKIDYLFGRFFNPNSYSVMILNSKPCLLQNSLAAVHFA